MKGETSVARYIRSGAEMPSMESPLRSTICAARAFIGRVYPGRTSEFDLGRRQARCRGRRSLRHASTISPMMLSRPIRPHAGLRPLAFA